MRKRIITLISVEIFLDNIQHYTIKSRFKINLKFIIKALTFLKTNVLCIFIFIIIFKNIFTASKFLMTRF